MNFFLFIPFYFRWHYSYAFKNIWGILTNYLWFVWNFFSIGLLSRTLLSPWRKMGEEYEKGFNIPGMISVFIVNTLMRGVGIVARLSVIFSGFISLIVVFLCGMVAFVAWFVMPLILLLCLALGIDNLLN